VVRYHEFMYQAASWDQARRVVAKVEWHQDELFPFTQFGVAMASSLARSISLEWAPFLIVLGGLAAVVGGLACLAKDEHPQGV